ncbi:MAG: type III-B CRISPR module-associated protein Cmr5 [Candidatus Thorarchaeota archaeon]|nr:type III-B CRISPR module-associated protein Cmr5 [Candidatus Thorarchaeota archaeon]
MMELNTTELQSLSRIRALYAWESVNRVTSEREKAKKYKSQVKKTPMYVKTNGLGATLAFLTRKSEYKPIFNDICKWLEKRKIISGPGYMDSFQKLNSAQYRIATKEALELLSWMSRFVDSVIEDDDNEQETTTSQ